MASPLRPGLPCQPSDAETKRARISQVYPRWRPDKGANSVDRVRQAAGGPGLHFSPNSTTWKSKKETKQSMSTARNKV